MNMTALQEATRLTRAGRLAEAAALLKDALAGVPVAARAAEGREPPTIDMRPPSPGQRTWTAPGEAAETGAGGLLGRLTEALKGGRATSGLGSVSPEPLPAGARFEERAHAGPTGSRTYKLYVPSTLAGRPAPLVCMLHGCTQNPDDFAAGTRMNALAEESGFLVVYPAQSKSANASRCWNWFNGTDQLRGSGEPAIVAGIVADVMREFPVDPGKVFAAGLSAGGAAAAVLGAVYPDLFSAIGVHSGLACGAARDMGGAFAAMKGGAATAPVKAGRPQGQPSRAIVFHGDRDRTVSPVNGDQVVAQFEGGSPPASGDLTRGVAPGGASWTRTRHLDAAGRSATEHWLVHGGGHAWSGGSPAGSYTDPRGPDASREMVRFFLET